MKMKSDIELFNKALTSPALKMQSQETGRFAYPANFRGRVPLKVRMAKTVTPDLPAFLTAQKGLEIVALVDATYFVRVNSYGAVTALLPSGEELGLLPQEFDVVEWHEPQTHNQTT
jgi:hypothetical protein